MRKIFSALVLFIPFLLILSCDDGGISDINNPSGGTGDGTGTETPATWIDLMESGDYETALTMVETEITAGSTDPEDLLYASLLNISKMSTSADVATIMTNAGFVDYPSNLNDMLNMNMPMTEFLFSSGYYDIDDNWVDTSYTMAFPKIKDSLGNVVTDYNMYMSTILENLVYAYPNGFNTPIRKMISVYNNVLPKALGYLTTLSNQDSINITKAMLGIGYDDIDEIAWPKDEFGNDLTISIGKAEVLGLIAVYELLAGIVNYPGSVDYTFPVKEIYDFFKTMPDSSDIADIPLAPGGTLFQTADDASSYLADSKMYMLSALTHIDEAVDLISARTGSSFMISPGSMGLSSWAENDIDDAFSAVRIFISKLKASISGGETVYIPLDLLTPVDTDADGFSDTSNLIYYGTEAAWPGSGDVNWGSLDGDPPSVLAFNLKAMFDQPIIAIDTFFDVDATTGEPVIYYLPGDTVVESFTAEDFADAEILPENYGIRLKDYTFGGLIQDPPETDYIVGLIHMMLSLPDGFLTATVDVTSIYFSPDTLDFYYSMFDSTPGDGFTSDYSEDQMYTTGSFWYHLIIGGSYYQSVPVVEEPVS